MNALDPDILKKVVTTYRSIREGGKTHRKALMDARRRASELLSDGETPHYHDGWEYAQRAAELVENPQAELRF